MSLIAKELATTLEHLTALVGFDTQNPPRAITTESDIFSYLKDNLPGFIFEMYDAGEGCISLLATRGNPEAWCSKHLGRNGRSECVR